MSAERRARWRRRGIFAANLALPPLIVLHWKHLSIVQRRLAVGLWVACRASVFQGTMLPNSSLFGTVIRRIGSDEPQVWLTLDDGPDPQSTPALLDLLETFKARATFFMIGRRVLAHPDLAREVATRGHDIGNHSQTHPSAKLWAYSRAALDREVGRCSRSITETTGVRPRFFRTPVGLTSPLLHSILERHDLRRVGWSARGFDAIPRWEATSVARILKKARPGAILLFHGEGRAAATGSARLRQLLEALERRGLRTTIPD